MDERRRSRLPDSFAPSGLAESLKPLTQR